MATRVTYQEALNILAGASGNTYTKQQAMNIIAGTTGLSTQQAANVYAGTVGLLTQDALNTANNSNALRKTKQDAANDLAGIPI